MPSRVTPTRGFRPPQILRVARRLATRAALGALPLAVGIAGSAHAAVHYAHAGAVKLPASSIKHVSGATCGKVKGVWRPGTAMTGHWFVTDTQRANNYQAAARHARGGAKRADLARARFYRQRATKHQPRCTPAPSRRPTGSTTPTTNPVHQTYPSPPAPTPPTPLRFSLSGAIGLTLGGTPTANGAALAASPAARSVAPESTAANTPGPQAVKEASAPGIEPAAAQPADASTPSLHKVQADGTLAPAVTSGSAPISHFLIGPDGKVYVVFSTPVDLDNTSQSTLGTNRCVLAEVDPSSGVPTCVDSSLWWVNWNTSAYYGGSAPIQFDSSGAIYYSGTTTSGQTVLRKFDGSTIHDLITDNVQLVSFTVAPNGTVVITGYTTSTGAQWTRRISPSGSLKTLTTARAWFTSLFPDGNVYMGAGASGGTITASGGLPVVARYDTAADQIDPKWWIANSTAGDSAYFDSSSVCSSATPSQGDFCAEAGASIKWQYSSPDGHVYALANAYNGGTLAQYYPTVRLLSSEVTTINVAAGAGNDVAIAGTTDAGQNVLTLLDPATGSERELIGPDNEIEFYHLSYAAHRNELLFDGLRFADDKYVVGRYNLSTGQLKIGATISGKLTDLQSF